MKSKRFTHFAGAIFLLISGLHFSANAQYYYRDILSRQQAELEMELFKAAKVKQVQLNSFEGDGNPSRGFFCERNIDRGFKTSDMFTRTSMTGPSQFLTTFNEDGTLASSYDSSLIAVTTTQFRYNETGKLLSTLTRMVSRDDDFHTEVFEEHIYELTEKGTPQKMHIVRNKRDTTTILFATDESGKIAIEKNTRTGAKYYYYYNQDSQLIQIAEDNAMKAEPYPNYIFTYNNGGRMSQMITTEEGGSKADYTIWRFTYDEDDLKSTERILSKERKPLGTIEYVYKKGK